MGISCAYESCTNHRPQRSDAKVLGLYQKSDPDFLESAGLRADPSAPPPPHSHKILARIPEPQSRVPNLAHLPLIAPCRGNFLRFLAFLQKEELNINYFLASEPFHREVRTTARLGSSSRAPYLIDRLFSSLLRNIAFL